MDLHDSPEEARFRRDVRAWLEENLPRGWGTKEFEAAKNADEEVAFLKQWQRTLFDGGWAGLDWPKEYGGRDIGVVESVIWAEEYTRVRGPNQMNIEFDVVE